MCAAASGVADGMASLALRQQRGQCCDAACRREEAIRHLRGSIHLSGSATQFRRTELSLNWGGGKEAGPDLEEWTSSLTTIWFSGHEPAPNHE